MAPIKFYDVTSEDMTKWAPQKNPKFWLYNHYTRFKSKNRFIRVINDEDVYIVEYKQNGRLYQTLTHDREFVQTLFEMYLDNDSSFKYITMWQEADEQILLPDPPNIYKNNTNMMIV
jgi:hypothetical protein